MISRKFPYTVIRVLESDPSDYALSLFDGVSLDCQKRFAVALSRLFLDTDLDESVVEALRS